MTERIGARELFLERERALALQLRAQRFFLALEMRVTPELNRDISRTGREALQGHLWRRASLRAALSRSVGEGSVGSVPVFDPSPTTVQDPLRAYERVLRGVIVEHYGPDPVAEGLAWAFEAFVAGRIATVHPNPDWNERLVCHGAPNSANYFLFAELAFLCVEADVAADFWNRLLGVLVASAHILAFHDESVGESGAPRFAHREGRALRVRVIDEVRRAYAELNALEPEERLARLEDSFGLLLGRCFERTHTSIGLRRRPLESAVLSE